MVHTAHPSLACYAGVCIVLTGLVALTGTARADTGVEGSGATGLASVMSVTPVTASAPEVGAGVRLHIGPLSRRGIEVGTLLSAEPGRERLYAYVDLQDRLPLPMRRVLRQADGGITVERGGAGLATESRPLPRASLGSMLRWRMDGGSLVALRLQARKVGLQVSTPLVF